MLVVTLITPAPDAEIQAMVGEIRNPSSKTNLDQIQWSREES